MKRAFVALGSNLSNPQQQVETAVSILANSAHVLSLSCAPWYGSKAIGPGKQDDYVNGVVRIETSLDDPHVLLDLLQDIEKQQGRTRDIKWGPRTLDLDLLYFEDESVSDARLELPHPRICERNFVLFPLCDLEPELKIHGKSVSEHKQHVSAEGIWRIDGVELEREQ
jgi:2-amino-4-hydroxy-6-hydroxymethyldihydropteridine diphosphokinase